MVQQAHTLGGPRFHLLFGPFDVVYAEEGLEVYASKGARREQSATSYYRDCDYSWPMCGSVIGGTRLLECFQAAGCGTTVLFSSLEPTAGCRLTLVGLP